MWKEMQEDIFENQVFTLSFYYLTYVIVREDLAELVQSITLIVFYINS